MLARVVLVLIAIALPLPALAVDVDLAFSFRIGPTIQLHDRIKKFNYQIRYSPIYQKFVEETEFDKLSHFLAASSDYQIGDRTSLSVTERFAFTQSVNQQGPGTSVGGIGSPRTETQRGDITSNTATLEVRHSFTPRISGQSTLTHQFFDSDVNSTPKNTSLGGVSSLSYAVSARDRVGFGGGVTWQQFNKVRGQPASVTYTYRIFASWLHNFGENTELSLRGGPALIDTNQDAPNSLPPGQNPGKTKDSSVTFFGEASLSHSWTPDLSSRLSYNRSDSSASSLGSNSVADRVSFLTDWNPSARWNLTLRGDWVQRKSSNDITSASFSASDPVTTSDRAVDTTYYSASLRAAYRASRRVTVTARLTYQNQDDNSASRTASSDFGDFVGFVGFRFELDPFHF
jgi:hypothetical protein